MHTAICQKLVILLYKVLNMNIFLIKTHRFILEGLFVYLSLQGYVSQGVCLSIVCLHVSVCVSLSVHG